MDNNLKWRETRRFPTHYNEAPGGYVWEEYPTPQQAANRFNTYKHRVVNATQYCVHQGRLMVRRT